MAAEAPIQADYRESLSTLEADPYGDVTPNNPAPTAPGMAHVVLDGAGRLREFQANPYTDAQALTPPVEPEAVFRAAGLDIAKFTEVPANFVPADSFRPGAFLEGAASPHPGSESDC